MANASARMMDAFHEGRPSFAQALRTGGTQTVTVQHVNVSEGGQAVVTGDIRSGGRDET